MSFFTRYTLDALPTELWSLVESKFCFKRSSIIAQSVEHCTGITELMASNPVGASKKIFLCNFKLFHNCEDHFHVYSLLFALRRHSFHRSSILARFHFTENVANVSRLHFRFHFVFAHPHKNDTARHCACVILLRGLGPMSCDRFLIGITQAFLKLRVLLLAFLAFLRMRNNVYNVPRFNENKVLLYYPSTKIGSTVVNLYHFQLERKPLQ